MFKNRPYLMRNTIQHYEWGTRGKEAYIPKLLGIKVEDNKPYAELWMGAHPKASSEILIDKNWSKLSDVIQNYPMETLGEEIAEKYNGKLPFLFKILSAGEPLSIQTHPSKEQAKILHRNDPVNYPDDNHKPEIAIALDELKALLGFKNINRIRETVLAYPGFAEFTDADNYKKLTEYSSGSVIGEEALIKSIYSSIVMDSRKNTERFAKLIKSIFNTINSRAVADRQEHENLFLQMFDKYGFDIGLISILFFNLITLSKGEAIYTPAGIPHAYIAGNIIECMANSDNVIRAGLTPKFQDVDNLLELIDYSAKYPTLVKIKKEEFGLKYLTTASEFTVRKFSAGQGDSLNIINNGSSIMLITEGKIKLNWNSNQEDEKLVLQRGESVFLPAILKQCSIKVIENTEFFSAGINN